MSRGNFTKGRKGTSRSNSDKWRQASIRNFAIFRMRGISANLDNLVLLSSSHPEILKGRIEDLKFLADYTHIVFYGIVPPKPEKEEEEK